MPVLALVLSTIGALVIGLLIGGAGNGGTQLQLQQANDRIGELERELRNGTSDASPDRDPTPATDARQPVTVAGDGEGNSATFQLQGSYTVTWQTLGSCYYSADLEGGGLRGEQVFTADAAIAGTNNLHGLPAADYYLEVITGPAPTCGWSVTFTPA